MNDGYAGWFCISRDGEYEGMTQIGKHSALGIFFVEEKP